MGPLYGYLASVKDLTFLDPDREALEWEACSYWMVTNDTALLRSQLERSEVLPALWTEH